MGYTNSVPITLQGWSNGDRNFAIGTKQKQPASQLTSDKPSIWLGEVNGTVTLDDVIKIAEGILKACGVFIR